MTDSLKKSNSHLLAAHVGINAPHFRKSRFYNFPASFEKLSSTPVSHADHHPRHLSALSPAAYFVDLVRLLKKHVPENTLEKRRPDLWKLLLDRAHTEDLVPFLEIVNHVMRAHLTRDDAAPTVGEADREKSQEQDRRTRKHLARERLATAQYPLALPLHMPLVEIRAYLAHFDVALSEVYKTCGLSEDEPAWVAEVLGLSRLEYTGLSVDLWSNSTEYLRKNYGLATAPSAKGIGGLENVATLLATTGLTPGELRALLQFVPGARVSGNDLEIKGLLYDTQDHVADKDLGFLAQLHYTIRLGARMHWSLTDVILATRCCWDNDKPRMLGNLARLKQLNGKYPLPIDVLCSFLKDMNTAASIDATGKPIASLFDRVFNTPAFHHTADPKEGGSRYDPDQHEAVLWNSTAQVHTTDDTHAAGPLDHQNIRGSLLAGLRVTNDELQAIVDHLCKKVQVADRLDATNIPLDVHTLTRFYRFSRMAQVLRMPVQDYLVLLGCINGTGEHGLESCEVRGLKNLQAVDFWADWLKSANLSADQFHYLRTGALDAKARRHLEPPFGASDEDLHSLEAAIRATVDACFIRPESFACATASSQQAREVYEALLACKLLDAISDPEKPKERRALVGEERTKPRTGPPVTCRQVIDALTQTPGSTPALVTLRAADLERPLGSTDSMPRADAQRILEQLQTGGWLDTEARLVTDEKGDLRIPRETDLSILLPEDLEAEWLPKRAVVCERFLRKADAIRAICATLNRRIDDTLQGASRRLGENFDEDTRSIVGGLTVRWLGEFDLWPNVSGEAGLRSLTMLLYLARGLDLSFADLLKLIDWGGLHWQGSKNELGKGLSLGNMRTAHSYSRLLRSFREYGSNAKNAAEESMDLAANLWWEGWSDANDDRLSALSGWGASPIGALRTALSTTGPGTQRPGLYAIETMQRCIAMATKLGVNAQTLIRLCDLGKDGTDFAGYDAAATGLLGAVKAKYARDEWNKIFGPIRDRLNERERDALAALLLHDLRSKHPESKPDPKAEQQQARDKAAGPGPFNWRFDTLQDLSEYLLIDVEMSGCAETSYVKEAIGCLQIYIERCRLHLEPGVALAHEEIPDSLWAWMGHFRMWEANRKVFFYPENYLEPSQRRQATPLFKELQSALLQTEVTEEAVTGAYVNYLDKLDDLAKLEIIDEGHIAAVTNPRTGKDEETLFLVARTRGDPPVYYHRSAIQDHARRRFTAWRPWEKIDITLPPISGFTSLYARNRLHVFWIEVSEKKETQRADSAAHTKRITKEAAIKYSYQKAGGGWLHPQVYPLRLENEHAYLRVSWDEVDGKGDEPKVEARQGLPVPHGAPTAELKVRADWSLCITSGVSSDNSSSEPEYLSLGPPIHLRDSVTRRFFAPLEKPTALAARPPDGRSLFAGSTTGLWRLDAGPDGEVPSWSLVDPALIMALAIAPDARTLVAAHIDKTGLWWMPLDHDAGDGKNVRWHAIPLGEQANKLKFMAITTARAARMPAGSSADAMNKFTFFASTLDEIYRCDIHNDGKATLSSIETCDELAGILSIAVAPDGETLFATGMRTLWMARLSENAKPVWRGVAFHTQYQLKSIVVTPDGRSLFASDEKRGWWHARIDQLASRAQSVAQIREGLSKDLTQATSFQFKLNQTLENAKWNVPEADHHFFPLRKIRSLTDHTLYGLATAPDGRSLFVSDATWGGVWCFGPYQQLATNAGPELAESIVTGGVDSLVSLRRQKILELPPESPLPASLPWRGGVDLGPKGIRTLAVAENGMLFAGVGEKKYGEDVGLWRLPGGLEGGDRRWVRIDKHAIDKVVVTPGGRNVFAARWGAKGVSKLRLDNGVEQEQWSSVSWAKPGDVDSLAMTRDGSALYAAIATRIYRADLTAEKTVLVDFSGSLDGRKIFGLAVAPDGKTLIVAGDWDGLWLVDTTAPSKNTRVDNPGVKHGGGIVVTAAGTVYAGVRSGKGVWCTELGANGSPAPLSSLKSLAETDVDALAVAVDESTLFVGNSERLARFELPTRTKVESRPPNAPAAFDLSDPYALYFREIFFHIPFLIADALNKNQQFEHARKWYEYILDPTRPADASGESGEEAGMWRYLPFRGHTPERLAAILSDPAHADALVKDPFDPHAIAQTRLGAYEKAVAMKYLDNLLDWGDMLFAQDSWEAINQAVLLYVRVLNLLGPKPKPQWESLAEPCGVATVADTHALNHPDLQQILTRAKQQDEAGKHWYENPFFDVSSTFCLPENDEFAQYWNRAQNCLYKIRHCMNAKGVVRQLALFQPPIDPRQLIRAMASGLDHGSAEQQPTMAVPHYRFSVVMQQARNMTATVIQLGSALLSALEKNDAEQLNLLRSTQEQAILKLTRAIKDNQIKDGVKHLEALHNSLEAAQHREAHFGNLADGGYSSEETDSQHLMMDALGFQTTSGLARALSVPGFSAPSIFGFSNGGYHIGEAILVTAQVSESTAMVLNQAAQLAAVKGQLARRYEDWDLQQKLATYDVQQIEAEIEAASIRQENLERDLEIHEKSTQHAQQRDAFFRSKFTDKELYQWMSGRLSTLYFQTYKLSFELARSAEKAYQYERHTNQSFLDFGLWDSLKKGLLAGEGMMLSLEQLDKAHLDGDARELEIEKTISLLQLDPGQLLALKRDGRCRFDLTEQLFDWDFPGHYCRRIKSVSISIPAVVGPHQNVHATLTQTSDRVLLEHDAGAVDALLTGNGLESYGQNVLRSSWRPLQKIAISKGIDDSGMFQLDFRDERYLPFEGTGAISSWELSMPKAANRNLDFASVSDVIVNLRYTALDGGTDFREKLIAMDKIGQYSGLRLISLRQEFPVEWQRFLGREAQREQSDDADARKTAALRFSLAANRVAQNCDSVKVPADSPIALQALWQEREGKPLRLTFRQPGEEKGNNADKGTPLEFDERGVLTGPVSLKTPGSAAALRFESQGNAEDPKWTITTDDPLDGLLDIILVAPFDAQLQWGPKAPRASSR